MAKKHYLSYSHSLYTCAIKNCVICAEHSIMNLSRYVLSTPSKLLLSKGLSFIPTARDVVNFEILSNFNQFIRKLRNKVHQPTVRPNQDGFNLFRKTTQLNQQSTPTKCLHCENALKHIKIELSNLSCNVRV